MTLDIVRAAISELKGTTPTTLVGISGFGGAGKSTLARELTDSLPECVRVRGDDFLDPNRSHRRSTDWDGVERARLFHPELAGAFDLTVWVDVELEPATAQGKARDHRLGRDHESLWDEVWVPNEQDFVERFAPRSFADLLFSP